MTTTAVSPTTKTKLSQRFEELMGEFVRLGLELLEAQVRIDRARRNVKKYRAAVRAGHSHVGPVPATTGLRGWQAQLRAARSRWRELRARERAVVAEADIVYDRLHELDDEEEFARVVSCAQRAAIRAGKCEVAELQRRVRTMTRLRPMLAPVLRSKGQSRPREHRARAGSRTSRGDPDPSDADPEDVAASARRRA